MENSILQKNLEVLKKRFGDIGTPIETSNEVIECELLDNQTYRLRRNNVDIFPYGQTDGGFFIKKWAEALSEKRNAIYVVSGFGTGLHIQYLLDCLDATSVVIAVDFDTAWLKWLFSHKDCTEILSNECFVLFTNDDFQILETIGLVHKNNLCTCIFSPLFVLHEKEYYQFFTEIFKQFDMRKKLQSTIVGDSELWQKNAIKNLETLINSPSLDKLKGKYKHFSFGRSFFRWSHSFLKACSRKGTHCEHEQFFSHIAEKWYSFAFYFGNRS